MTALLELVLISLGLSFLAAIPYRLLTKPEEMRRAKAEVSLVRKQMGEARRHGDMAEVTRLMNQMLKANQVQMRQNMKPMLPSALIFILALGTLNSYGPVALETPVQNATQNELFFGTPLNISGQLQNGVLSLDTNKDGRFETRLKDGEAFRQGEYYWQARLGEKPQLEAQLAHSPVILPLLQFAFPPVYLSHFLSWFWIYFIILIPTTILFRKLLGAE